MALHSRNIKPLAHQMRKPRLEPSIAPMSDSPEANIVPYLTEDLYEHGRAMHLEGDELEKYVEGKVAEARVHIRGAGVKEK